MLQDEGSRRTPRIAQRPSIGRVVRSSQQEVSVQYRKGERTDREPIAKFFELVSTKTFTIIAEVAHDYYLRSDTMILSELQVC